MDGRGEDKAGGAGASKVRQHRKANKLLPRYMLLLPCCQPRARLYKSAVCSCRQLCQHASGHTDFQHCPTCSHRTHRHFRSPWMHSCAACAAAQTVCAPWRKALLLQLLMWLPASFIDRQSTTQTTTQATTESRQYTVQEAWRRQR